MDKVTVNRAAKALADRQLIRRQAHEADGRSHHLELTETGWSLYDAIVPAALATEERLESHLSGKERSEEHTSELQSLMRISYAVFCSKKKKHINTLDTYAII